MNIRACIFDLGGTIVDRYSRTPFLSLKNSFQRRNINFGKGQTETIEDSHQRWRNMIRIALGQSKMVRRPIAGILHIVVYLGFIIINIELIEIIIDGVFGTHRIFSSIGVLYGVLIGLFEIFALALIKGTELNAIVPKP